MCEKFPTFPIDSIHCSAVYGGMRMDTSREWIDEFVIQNPFKAHLTDNPFQTFHMWFEIFSNRIQAKF